MCPRHPAYVSIFDSEDEESPNRQIIENILADDVQNPENVWIDAEKTEQIVEQIIKNLSKRKQSKPHQQGVFDAQ